MTKIEQDQIELLAKGIIVCTDGPPEDATIENLRHYLSGCRDNAYQIIDLLNGQD